MGSLMFMELEETNTFPERYARIVARSQRQAMDWSLVLASQDIHPIIAAPEESNQWALLVDPEKYNQALEAIRVYRLENRGWAWRKELPGSALEIHSGALFWCLFLAVWHWVSTFIWPVLQSAGRMDSLAVRSGAWYRLFTPVLLHSDLAHLMANAVFGVLILGLAMARFGPGITLLVTFAAGVLGNIIGLGFYTFPYTGVGASGMMMGALGLLCIHSFGLWRKSAKAARYILSGVIAGFLIFVLFGLTPGSDILAHLGGFVGGLAFGAVLAFVPENILAKPLPNMLALFGLVATIALTWALALRSYF
jgi:rhomboid protease GluP